MKGSRDRTADREAYRNSPVWENMRLFREDPRTPKSLCDSDVHKEMLAETRGPDLPPGVDPEDVPV